MPVTDRMNRLREIRRVSERGSYVGTSEVLWLLDEIEHLTRELAEARSAYDLIKGNWGKWEAEADRLRAALEWIANDPEGQTAVRKRAREALRGGK